ncbi:MAG TPA: ABC transporter substrate-binding protein [Methylomirabilota bacterium]|nr:ABC transporter substrate-binding protein [Methylomirabilota bacterium]
MTLRRLVLALALAVALAPPALAGAPTEQLRLQVDRVIKTLEDPQLKHESKTVERRRSVRRIANEIFDFGETAKRSLGRHWQARTPAEREEFVQLFADLLERSYISKIELFNGERVTYIGETIDGDIATVRTRLVTKQATEIPVDYRMRKRDERWLVYDVIIEGVSLVANYRTQFNKIIQTSSYPDLIKKMKGKQEELLEQEKKRT